MTLLVVCSGACLDLNYFATCFSGGGFSSYLGEIA
jgi:hypothetical protein